MTMTTAAEFAKSGITGQTFREITEKFGMPFNEIGKSDAVMGNYALAFAWYRAHEHMPVPAAYDKAMTLTINEVEALFEDGDDPAVKAAVDFDSQPPKTTP